jgi:hypothetical protein
MTATLDHWTDLHPAAARDPLLAEMHDAGRQALLEPDPQRKVYFTGLFTGYAVGFGLITREALDRARRTPFSTNLPLDFWRPHPFADADSYWATGVRRGYLLSTSEHPHADECVLCGERLIEDLDPTDWCVDGLFCELDNHRAEWHRQGPSSCQMEDE